jgi:hypothetical protein
MSHCRLVRAKIRPNFTRIQITVPARRFYATKKSYSHAEHKIVIISRKEQKAYYGKLLCLVFVQSVCMEDT